MLKRNATAQIMKIRMNHLQKRVLKGNYSCKFLPADAEENTSHLVFNMRRFGQKSCCEKKPLVIGYERRKRTDITVDIHAVLTERKPVYRSVSVCHSVS